MSVAQLIVAAPVPIAETLMFEMTGAPKLDVNVSVFDAWLPFVVVAVEEAMSAPIITVTAPLEDGARSNVKLLPLPLTLPTVAFVVLMSLDVSPETSSEKVAVMGIAIEFVVVALLEVSTTVGPPVSANAYDAIASIPAITIAAVAAATAFRCSFLIICLIATFNPPRGRLLITSEVKRSSA